MKKTKIISLIFAIILLAVVIVFFQGEKIFYFAVGICIVIAILPFIISVTAETEKEKEKERMFLEFSRNLVESVRSGTPISRSIINVKRKDYGPLSAHIDKLANQISLGIPVREALDTFALDLNNATITRAITLIKEAEEAGGSIENILESAAESVSETEKLKKERKAAIYNLVVQGYIIFFIFVVIMLIMQFKILPMTAGISAGGLGGLEGIEGVKAGAGLNVEDLTRPFLFLLITQGFFAGLVIGKLAEGNIKAGIKHSFILMILAGLISTGATALFG